MNIKQTAQKAYLKGDEVENITTHKLHNSSYVLITNNFVCMS